MKTTRSIICYMLMLLSTLIAKAQIIAVTEIDRGNARIISTSDQQIIDINASLEINLSKTELLRQIAEQFPQYAAQTELESKINSIRQVLSNQEQILNSLMLGVERVEDQEQFFNLMDDFLVAIGNNKALAKRYEDLSAEYFSLENSENVTMEAYIFSRFNDAAALLHSQLKLLEATNYNISLVAFKKDKQGGDRVHVQNFDTYTERDYVTIERWVTSLSASKEEQLAELAEKAKDNNEKALTIFESLKSKLKVFLPDLSCVQAQKENLMAFLNNLEANSEQSDAIKERAELLKSDLNELMAFIESLNLDIRSWGITTPFAEKDKLLNFLQKSNDLNKHVDALKVFTDTIDGLAPQLDELYQGFKGCFTELKTYAETIQETLILLKLQQSNYTLNKTIGDEVQRFSMDNLPSRGFVNLKGTGSRSNGDELVLEVVMRVPSEKEGIPDQNFVLEQRSLYMQLIGARSEVAVGMILANPLGKENEQIDAEREFFYAPTASILLKFGSKKSYFYNEFIDLGVGLNFAAPDFDTDGTPEFGTGLIITGFKDIISFGINYNVTLDEPYWFFGVNLPFNLPGFPINAIKN